MKLRSGFDAISRRRIKGDTIPGIRTPIMLDGKPADSGNPAPRPGQHTAEILKEIGEG